jgi:transcription initiation factor TFIIA small subunit
MTDALDQFITEGRIAPQIAIKMLAHFDKLVAEVLGEKVKARMSFKVRFA